MIVKKDKDGKIENADITKVPTAALIMVLIEAVLDGKMASSELGMARIAMANNKDLRVDLKAQGRLREIEDRRKEAKEEIKRVLTELDARL